MEVDMQSKWKWIAAACKAKGYEKAAEIANQIEHALQELYGETTTKAWESATEREGYMDIPSPEKASDFVISIVSADIDFCIACVTEQAKHKLAFPDVCYACTAGEIYGKCLDEDSLLVKFDNAFSEGRKS